MSYQECHADRDGYYPYLTSVVLPFEINLDNLARAFSRTPLDKNPPRKLLPARSIKLKSLAKIRRLNAKLLETARFMAWYELDNHNRALVKAQYSRVAKAKRNSRLRQQTPAWSEAVAIKAFYKACPKGYHVDHIVPLAARMSTNHPQLASGLHVLANLQYALASDNVKKHSYFNPWFECSFPEELNEDPDEGLKDSYARSARKLVIRVANRLVAFKEAVWCEQNLGSILAANIADELTTLLLDEYFNNHTAELLIEWLAAELDTLPINFEETPYHV